MVDFDGYSGLLDYTYSDLDAGKIVISLFFDFQNKFDCVDHKILLKKLEKYGVRGIVLKFFETYTFQIACGTLLLKSLSIAYFQ